MSDRSGGDGKGGQVGLQHVLPTKSMFEAHWSGHIFSEAAPEDADAMRKVVILFSPFDSRAMRLRTQQDFSQSGESSPACFVAGDLRRQHPDFDTDQELGQNPAIERDLLLGISLAWLEAKKKGMSIVLDCTSLKPNAGLQQVLTEIIRADRQVEMHVVVAQPLQARVAQLQSLHAAALLHRIDRAVPGAQGEHATQLLVFDLDLGMEPWKLNPAAGVGEGVNFDHSMLNAVIEAGMSRLVVTDPWGTELTDSNNNRRLLDPSSCPRELQKIGQRPLTGEELDGLAGRLNKLLEQLSPAHNPQKPLSVSAEPPGQDFTPFREAVHVAQSLVTEAQGRLVQQNQAPVVASPLPTPLHKFIPDISEPRLLSPAELTARDRAQAEFFGDGPIAYLVVGDSTTVTDRYLAKIAAKMAEGSTEQSAQLAPVASERATRPNLVLSSNDLAARFSGGASLNEPLLIKVDPAISPHDFAQLIAQCRESGFRPQLQLVPITQGQAVLEHAKRIATTPLATPAAQSASATPSNATHQQEQPSMAASTRLLASAVAAGLSRVAMLSSTGTNLYDTIADQNLRNTRGLNYCYPGQDPTRIQQALQAAQQRTLSPPEQAQLAVDWATLVKDLPANGASAAIRQTIFEPAAAAAGQVGRSPEARNHFTALCGGKEAALELSAKMVRQLLGNLRDLSHSSITVPPNNQVLAQVGGVVTLMGPEHAVIAAGAGRFAIVTLGELAKQKRDLPKIGERLEPLSVSLMKPPGKGPEV